MSPPKKSRYSKKGGLRVPSPFAFSPIAAAQIAHDLGTGASMDDIIEDWTMDGDDLDMVLKFVEENPELIQTLMALL